ncbi:cytidine deaminase [Nocardioides marmorisolisilvae]|uniref:Cytidine deaminase n=1 Tax=Nocardioides marmorisolisilvae TaxID=1542737 RepID=A0A3N0DTN8_9ACTN|nr:cytidine deaminase [Nocardioides marmorisolisilvae]RNL78881.1 cytidine deaminase [Nocardioides marmorisolisilvae]
MTIELSNPEDSKLVVLAKATRARTGAAQGAALRDLDGRTYAGATVDLPSLQVSALDVCIAMAVASGAKGAEAAVVLGAGDGALDALREFAGEGVPVHLGAPNGSITESVAT